MAPSTYPEGIINTSVLLPEHGLGTVTAYLSLHKKWVCSFIDALTLAPKTKVALDETAVIKAIKDADAARRRCARSDANIEIEGL
jgi:hypothetical protein